ncbi:MAG: sulfatase/phosphatase domain-containing protein, partial [Planctomycetota bacterium]
GGIRVPLIVHFPGVTRRGAVCERPVCVIDFYPTFCRIVGVDPQAGQHLDGVSILGLLKSPKASVARDTLYWHYPLAKPHFLGGRSCGAIRKGDWKLIEFFDDGHLELYNLKDDIGEKNNLAEKTPDKTKELHQLLQQWRRSIKAQLPPD